MSKSLILNIPEGLNTSNALYSVKSGGCDCSDAVRYTQQALTDAEKQQARENIGVDTYIQAVLENTIGQCIDILKTI